MVRRHLMFVSSEEVHDHPGPEAERLRRVVDVLHQADLASLNLWIKLVLLIIGVIPSTSPKLGSVFMMLHDALYASLSTPLPYGRRN